MLSDNIVEIISKYQNFDEITKINNGIREIIRQLKHINNNISEQLYMLMDNTEVDDGEGEIQLIKDSQILRSYISTLKTIPCLCDIDQNEEGTQSIDFTENLFASDQKEQVDDILIVYMVDDYICPICNVKLISHNIVFNTNNKPDNIYWYRCPCCNKLFCIDREVEDFDFDNTNFILKQDYYNKPIKKDLIFTDIIVLSTIAMCTHKNHKLKDVIARIPIINGAGNFEFTNLTVSYCSQCNQYIMLKSDFLNLSGIIACKVIDKTSVRDNKDCDDLERQQHESILYQYGYNVKTKENLSDKQRHLILASVIESGILTREEVCSHLDVLIERGRKIEKWKLATHKWNQDRHYVKKYNTSNLPEVLFDKVILKYSHSTQLKLNL